MDDRDHCGSIACTLRGKKLKLTLFDAQEWEEKRGADTELYRIQLGRSWYSPGGRKYEFFSVDGIISRLRQFLVGETEIENIPAKPTIQAGQRVRWMRSTYPPGEYPGILTWTLTPPFLAIDGRWRVFLRGARAGLVPLDSVPCDEIQPL